MILQFPKRTYVAKLFNVSISGITVKVAGTLDGYIDVAVIERDSRTYTISRDEARSLADALRLSTEDINANCLFDNDVLLACNEVL